MTTLIDLLKQRSTICQEFTKICGQLSRAFSGKDYDVRMDSLNQDFNSDYAAIQEAIDSYIKKNFKKEYKFGSKTKMIALTTGEFVCYIFEDGDTKTKVTTNYEEAKKACYVSKAQWGESTRLLYSLY